MMSTAVNSAGKLIAACTGKFYQSRQNRNPLRRNRCCYGRSKREYELKCRCSRLRGESRLGHEL
jgi:hypothetical protein